MPDPIKKLILVRHAHRDKALGRDTDNGISAKGKKQAEEFQDFFNDEFEGENPVIYSSPKKRCVETVEPLAKMIKAKVQIQPLLDEQDVRSDEAPDAFTKRIKKFLAEWKTSKDPLIIACSHGDWIPEFCFHAVGNHREVSKGEWLVFEFKSGQIRISSS